jgi:alcohol dehydrogenase class IV
MKPMQFEFATANKIRFGQGTIKEVGSHAALYGKRALVVYGPSEAGLEQTLSSLKTANLEWVTYLNSVEPDLDVIENGLKVARTGNCDVMIGVGGGSVIDTAKTIAALLTNPGDLIDYLEVVGHGKPITRPSVPFIAIPTTAGTGSEVTRNAVLSVPAKKVKVSLRSPFMMARLALVDPELTISVPPAVTASTGMDAFVQVMEPFVSSKANWMTDLFCKEGLTRVSRSLLKAYQNGNDIQPREDMSWVSLLGGLSLANAGLGAVHGFAGPVGGMFSAPHGAVCAAMFAAAMDVNIRALKTRQPDHPALGKYLEAAKILTQSQKATVDDGVTWIKDLCRELHIPPLKEYGVKKKDIPLLVEKGEQASSMKGNPIPLLREELEEILTMSM